MAHKYCTDETKQSSVGGTEEHSYRFAGFELEMNEWMNEWNNF